MLQVLFRDYRQRKEYLPSLLNREAIPRTKRGSIKSTRTKTRKRTRSTRSTNIVTRIEAKIKTRRKRRIKVGIMILVATIQRSITRRSTFSDMTFVFSHLML